MITSALCIIISIYILCLSTCYSMPNKSIERVERVENEVEDLLEDAEVPQHNKKLFKRSNNCGATPCQLKKGEKLAIGQSIISPTRNIYPYYVAKMTILGYFVVRRMSYNDQFGMWSTGTRGSTIPKGLEFKDNGNLVLEDGNGNIMWQSYTSGKGGIVLKMQDDGRLVMYDDIGHDVWATNYVLAGNCLPVGQSIWNGRYQLKMGADGNLVISKPDGTRLCANMKGYLKNVKDGLCMDEYYGDLFIKDSNGMKLWESDVGHLTNPGDWFQLSSTGQLEVYNFVYGIGVIWTSTCHNGVMG